MVNLKIAYRTSIGMVREKNEDTTNYFYDQNQHLLAIVADGIGGNRAGEVASKMAVDGLGKCFEQQSTKSIKEASKWFDVQLAKQNEAIIETSLKQQALNGMGTTFVGAILIDHQFVVTNIGDSRGYLLHHNHLKQLTEDHSYINELLKTGKISAQEAKHYPYQHVIVRSLGVSDQANPSTTVGQLQFSDQLLLCSDGLTDLVADSIIELILKSSRTVDEKCQKLIDIANQNGGLDNISVLIIEFNSDQGVDIHD